MGNGRLSSFNDQISEASAKCASGHYVCKSYSQPQKKSSGYNRILCMTSLPLKWKSSELINIHPWKQWEAVSLSSYRLAVEDTE